MLQSSRHARSCLRAQFDKENSTGLYHSAEGSENADGKRSYFRMMKMDCSENGAIDRLKQIFTNVFHNLAMRVVVKGAVEQDSHVFEAIELLKEIPHLHFAASE